MTDPHPLLSHTAPPEKGAPPQYQRSSSLDDTIEHCIGDLGWKHILQATLVSFAWFFDAQQTFISVFTDAEPQWSCVESCAGADLCQLPAAAWAWVTPADASIISDWSLQCAGSIVKGLPASSFFFGCLVGGFALATLADSSLGRKKMLVLSSLLMSLTGVLTALSTGIWMYTALRFVSGFGRATIGTCALVLSTELVGKKWRENIGIIGFICFTLGFLSLPVIAYWSRDSSWRLMYLWTCVPSVIYSISLMFIVPESPRWLFIKGRKEEFEETLRSMAAPTNRSSLTQSFFSRCGDDWVETSQETDMFSAAKILVKKGWSCRRLVSMMVVGFGIGMVYYGMPLGLGNLSVNLYVSVTLNAVSEFPASLFTFLLIGKLNRKGAVLGLCVMSGICSVCCVVVSWQGMQIVLELLSFFCACTAFDIVLIYTLELFPTSVRNSAVSMVRQALVFGGVLSPVLVAAGRKNSFLSYGVFGIAISVCALFVVCLPETRGRLLCDTIEEEERRYATANDDGVYCI
ncbi:organic cation/carnitine transporter 3-like [Salvia miltiorrhiza]|uniref:organic cation/carnitine transporter 3-like n=1 Tax=Salvia miltiorrhiza TaxID=226208 RepID=UPI0025AB7E2C|nr:organic cation/carnitine transporter 3-like [Salvia miltiorrhiza]